VSAAAPAAAGGVAGNFDFYVLALSWSPATCNDRAECALARGFVVHGLWPEYEHGYPDYCPSDHPRDLDAAAIAAIGDLIPDPSLAAHEWVKHGLCSGLGQQRYFALVKAAAARVTIPPAFADGAPARLSPRAVEQAFVEANPGLATGGLSVQCRRGQLTEIRVCLTKDLAFRPCAEVDADSCHARSLAVPAPR
jgi:ribonuclease T2